MDIAKYSLVIDENFKVIRLQHYEASSCGRPFSSEISFEDGNWVHPMEFGEGPGALLWLIVRMEWASAKEFG